jgi:hypothetical protein
MLERLDSAWRTADGGDRGGEPDVSSGAMATRVISSDWWGPSIAANEEHRVPRPVLLRAMRAQVAALAGAS